MTTPYRIIALGDSLTYGYPFGQALSWVEHASRELGIPILNQGINGDNLSHMLSRLTRDVLDLRPEFCLIMGGTNDLFQEVELETMKENFTKLTDRLLDTKILPVIGLPPPVKGAANEKRLAKFRNWLKRHARACSLKTLDFYSAFMDSKKKRMLPSYLEDGVHPSSKGYEAMGQVAIKTIKDLLAKS